MQNRQDDIKKTSSQSNGEISDNQRSKWISHGSPCFRPTTEPPTLIKSKQPELPERPLQRDKNRNMYFYDRSLDDLPPCSPFKPDHEVIDKDGNVCGIVFSPGGKMK